MLFVFSISHLKLLHIFFLSSTFPLLIPIFSQFLIFSFYDSSYSPSYPQLYFFSYYTNSSQSSSPSSLLIFFSQPLPPSTNFISKKFSSTSFSPFLHIFYSLFWIFHPPCPFCFWKQNYLIYLNLALFFHQGFRELGY